MTIIRSENTNLLFYFCLLNYLLLRPLLLKEKINITVFYIVHPFMYFFSMCCFSFLLYIAIMSSKYCSKCPYKLPISSFLKDALASPSSRVYSTCIQCRSQKNTSNSKKRAALQSLDPNVQPAKRVHRSNGLQAPLPLNLPIELPPLPPNSPAEPRPQAPVTALPLTEPTGFLPADEWR
jgi:hypothetical protein